MKPIQITSEQFKKFINRCVVQYDGDTYESNGYLKDDQGNVIASIDYDTQKQEVEGEVYINDDEYFEPSEKHITTMLEKIDEETFIDRQNIEELRNDPDDPYELYGLSRKSFF